MADSELLGPTIDVSPTNDFIGDAEAILAVSDNADDGIKDLVDSYKSNTWENPAETLDLVKSYADKLRQKTPGESNLLSPQETMDVAPVKPGEVDNYINVWEEQNLAKIKESTDPMVRAYEDQLKESVEEVATGAYQQANVDNDESQFWDKTSRITLGAIPGLIKDLGVEKYVERNLRADSNDTFASTLSSAAGSILALPVTVPNLILNTESFGREQYNKARQAGATKEQAALSGTMEGLNQAMDVVLDKVLLGTKERKATGVVVSALKRGLGEGTQEYVQNKVSAAADLVGLNKDEFEGWLTDQDIMSASAGFIVGGGGAVVTQAMPGKPEPEDPYAERNSFVGLSEQLGLGEGTTVLSPEEINAAATNDLASELGLNSYPETQPPNRVAVVGEPAVGAPNVTTVEDASEAKPTDPQTSETIADTDAGEIFLLNLDGTTSRVVDGEEKQAHQNATIISEEDAAKIAQIQASEPGGIPIPIEQDDLGRPFIQHPNVGPDLVVSEEINNSDPVLINEAESGHVLQYSERQNNLDSVEHSATISLGKSTGPSTVGAQEVKVSSIAEKLRVSDRLNPQVKELLGLNEDFAFGLTYVPNTNNATLKDVNDLFSKFDNNYVSFANEISSKDYGDVTVTEAIAARFASDALTAKANELRVANPDTAALYDTLAARMWTASQRVATETAQGLQRFSVAPVTGNTLITAANVENTEIATAKVAQEEGLSTKQVEGIVEENNKLDALSAGLDERENIIAEQEQAAQDQHDAPDKAVETLEQEVNTLETQESPEIKQAQKELADIEGQLKETEQQAATLEKEADDAETSQEETAKDIEDLNNKIKTIEAKPIDPNTAKLDALKEKKKEVKESPEVLTAKKTLKEAKGISEKAKARLELTKLVNEEKARGIKERAELDAQIKKAQEELNVEKEKLKQQKAEELKAAKEELNKAKEQKKQAKDSAIREKRKQANELRAEQKRIKSEKEAALREAKKLNDADKAARKKELKERLQRAKEERMLSKKLRKEQLDLERQKLKQARENLSTDRKKINERKERNKRITDAVDRYKKEFAAKLTPEITNKINGLVQFINTASGTAKKNALEELGKTIAKVKGVDLIPGFDPFSAFWQFNVLASVGTNTANIVGNFVTPVRQFVTDLATAKPGKAFKFIRGWASAMFSGQTFSLKNFRESDIIAGLHGELDSRSVDKMSDKDIKDIASGTLVIHENDAIRGLQKYFGTGRFGKFLSSVGIVGRMLGTMDAVFARASKEGRLAREAPSYEQYLKTKAADYNTFVTQARNEKAQLEKLGVTAPKNYVNKRADELSFLSRPEEQREAVTRAQRKDVFQEEGGPRGLVGRFTRNILNSAANVPLLPGAVKNVNAKRSVAAALGLTRRTARDNVSIDEIYPMVSKGVAQGKTLVINGKEVKAGSTKTLLGELVEAVNNKQVIGLKGDSIKPLKYAVGMFVNTSSQILDLSMETIPFLGYLDKRLGGKFHEYTADEKAQLYGTQIAASVLTGSILSALIPNMDDEDTAPFYIYGGMTDQNLRKYYEGKNIKPFSMRIGNTTISYKDIPGLNLIFGGIGGLSDAYMVAKRTPDRPLTTRGALEAMGVGSLYAASQLSLLKNVGTLADLLAGKQEAQFVDVLSNISAGFVPFSGSARELERFVYGDLSKPKNTQNRLLQNIPFAKFFSDNKPMLNLFGEPVRESVTPGIGRFFGESRNSYELDWVLRNGYAISLPKPSQALTKKQLADYSEMQESNDPSNFEPYLTEEDQYEYMKIFGPELKAILGSYADSYPQGYDEDVQKRLTNEIDSKKAEVKRSILSQ